MANTFARAYYKRTARAFDKWKESDRADKHKKDILKRMLEHWLKQGGKYLLAVMMNWKALAKINDTKTSISNMEYEMNDMALVKAG